jgi:histone acetyltransferase 1
MMTVANDANHNNTGHYRTTTADQLEIVQLPSTRHTNIIMESQDQERKALSDEPSLSSAALATTLHLGENSFAPEFTHQCLQGEFYRGYRPLDSVVRAKSHSLDKNTTNDLFLLHESHRFHHEASSQLEVRIQLAPSCDHCRVDIHRTPITEDVEPPTKKIKGADGCTTTTVPTSDDEIRAAIGKALPLIIDENCHDDYLNEPVGKTLKEYTRESGGDSLTFLVTVAEGPSVVNYHSQIQKLALWFIENADDVDVADHQSGFWKVLYLFQKHPRKGYSLSGYLTLFHFNAPFHKPTPGVIARICQVLVVPPFQGQGHGTQLMQCVYDLAHGVHSGIYQDHETIVQVNVEDPSPGFTLLRNAMDLKFLTLKDHLHWWPANTMVHRSSSTDATTTSLLMESQEAFVALDEKTALHVAAKARILPRQVQLVNEMVNFQLLRQASSTTKEQQSNEDLEKRFRLMIKGRLNREHREDISEYPSKDDKKAYLNRLYDEEIKPYETWLRKQHIQGIK